jgi:hypothetical protein
MLHSTVLGIDSYVRQLGRGLELPGPDITAGHTHLRELMDMFGKLAEVMRETMARIEG